MRSRLAAWLRRHPVAKFAASAILLYACLYPVWSRIGPPYGVAVAQVYAKVSTIFEYPRRTGSVSQGSDGLIVHDVEGRPTLKAENRNTFVDLAILVALALCSPGISWGARVRIAVLGYVPLGLAHLVGFASAAHLGYAMLDYQQSGIEPGYFTGYFVKGVKDVVYSDLILLLPFVSWGVLYVRERDRLPPPR